LEKTLVLFVTETKHKTQ